MDVIVLVGLYIVCDVQPSQVATYMGNGSSNSCH